MLTIEHRLLIDLCRDERDARLDMDPNQLRRLRWPEIHWQAAYHKLEGLIAHKTVNGFSWAALNAVIAAAVKNKHLLNTVRNQVVYDAALPEILSILRSVTSDFVVMKGVLSAIELYDHIGERPFGDVDVLVGRNDLEKVKQAFSEAGYEPIATFDAGGRPVRRADPDKIRHVERVTDQTYPLTKIDDANPLLARRVVDLHFAFGRPARGRRLDRHSVIQSILGRRASYRRGELTIPGLSREDFLLFACLHLFKDEQEVWRMQRNADGYLLAYAEIRRAVLRWTDIDWSYVISRTAALGMERCVYYCLHHAASVFPEIRSVVANVLERFRPSSSSFLDEWGGFDTDETGKWPLPFVDRLFLKHKFAYIQPEVTNVFH